MIDRRCCETSSYDAMEGHVLRQFHWFLAISLLPLACGVKFFVTVSFLNAFLLSRLLTTKQTHPTRPNWPLKLAWTHLLSWFFNSLISSECFYFFLIALILCPVRLQPLFHSFSTKATCPPPPPLSAKKFAIKHSHSHKHDILPIRFLLRSKHY